MNYYIEKGKLDNTIYDIDYEYLRKLYYDNQKEILDAEKLTASTYNGENFYGDNVNFGVAFEKEVLVRDQQTAGMLVQYPHGVMIRQPALRNYYRGENQIYQKSVPSLLRKLETFESEKDKALYRLVADMRIAEFKHLIDSFAHVKNWKYGDVLYDLLAQHYGLETGWLDITSDFNVALFFATCWYDCSENRWKPLCEEQIRQHPYGMIFHMPAWQRAGRWLHSVDYFTSVSNEVIEWDEVGNPRKYKGYEYPPYKGVPENLIYPIGYQPFMRCAMQYGYGIYMRTPQPLQKDYVFEKLRFKHSEKLSKNVFDMMEGGEKVYPHEGLKEADFIINRIRVGTLFSEEAFQYALYRSHEYALADGERCREDLSGFRIDGQPIKIVPSHPYKISSARKKRIDNKYADFSLEKDYGLKILRRGTPQELQGMFAPWMLPEKENQPGVVDFKPRRCVRGIENLWTWHTQAILSIIRNAQLPEF